MIQFTCNGCGKHFAVPDTYAGRHARCKGCGGMVQVPAAPPDQPTDQPADRSAAQSPPPRLPLRSRRLAAEAEQMRQAFSSAASPIQIESTQGDPPEVYHLLYRVAGLQPGSNGQPAWRDEHRVEIECTAEYPRISPRCRILTPIFHPNFDQTTICVGDHWTAGERLVDLVVRIGEMIAYQAYNIKSPLDGEAAMWADLNPDQLPTDTRDLRALIDQP